MSDPRETEQRLRSWLDGNQPARERMCLHLLPLLGDYSNVTPRRPKGGRDGARDLQAVYQDSVEVWGAVGFQNSANDSKEDKKWVEQKFSSDLRSALDRNPGLQGFAFFTNVDLTPAEQQNLKSQAAESGLIHVDIFYRERLRQVLDSTEGLGYRLQYLGIKMSIEEQIAFVNRLEEVRERELRDLAARHEEVDRKLHRIEFLNECLRPLHNVTALVALRESCAPDTLGHFRFAVQIQRIYEPSAWPSLFVGGRDAYWVSKAKEASGHFYGIESLIWSEEPYELLQSRMETDRSLETRALKSSGPLFRRGPFSTVGELDRTSFNIFVTGPLLDLIERVSLIVNDYAIVDFPRECLVTAAQVGLACCKSTPWPKELSEDERLIEWEQLFIRGPDTENVDLPRRFRHRSREIHFSEFTPSKSGLPAERGGSLRGKMNLVFG